MNPVLHSVLSPDGTLLSFDQLGDGPPVILVLGAFNTRPTGGPLADALVTHHTVVNYDRRGRGSSGDAASYAVEREIEDLDALVRHVGGSARVFGYSSGAALALAAAVAGVPMDRLVLYDLPLRPPEAPPGPDHAAALDTLVRAGRRGDAVEYFQLRMVGLPEPLVAELRLAPFRPALERMAHTLVYEALILGDGRVSLAAAAAVRVPTLAIVAQYAPPFMRQTAERLASALPDGRALVLPDATHDLDPARLAPVLTGFFAERGA